MRSSTARVPGVEHLVFDAEDPAIVTKIDASKVNGTCSHITHAWCLQSSACTKARSFAEERLTPDRAATGYRCHLGRVASHISSLVLPCPVRRQMLGGRIVVSRGAS